MRPIAEIRVLEQAEAALYDGYRSLLAHSQAARAADRLLASPEGALTLIGVGLTIAIAVLVIARLRRRLQPTGQLSLRLRFPEEVEGTFEVRLQRSQVRRNYPITRWRRSREIRSGVRRETQFDRVATGPWILTIEGELRAPISQARLATIDEQLEVDIMPNASTVIEHALPAVAAPVAFRVRWDRRPTRDVGLRLRDRPDSLWRARRGEIEIPIPLGSHAVVIGAGDRIVEQTVDVRGYEPMEIELDLAAPDGLVFKGCPPAVEPFLENEIAQAAVALAHDGQSEIASLLRARRHEAEGQPERAAEHYEAAGRIHEAAELRSTLADYTRAARLYERAGDPRKAAEMHETAGQWAEAARLYAAEEDWADAARCYEQAGDQARLIDALEAQGAFFRAAALASEIDDRARTIRLLQKVGPLDPNAGRASELLALAFEQEGHLDLAVTQLARRLDALAPGETAPQLELHLAELLEETGDCLQALEVLEALRDREPTFPQVAARIEGLRKKLSGSMQGMATVGFEPPSGATAFVAAQRYEILDEIGRGGMGLVYKARDRRLGRVVALKRMPENLRDHPAAVQLFLSEAQAAARMNHPNIVTLYDADQENGCFFITMELLEGLPLNTILKQRGRFGPRDTAQLAIQICAGLQFAHEKGIVHRDIKTANLFVTRDRSLKIMDFGLAKILEAVRDNNATVIAGTPFYMAPEQTRGQVADGRTDLYSLGVTLFELSTGRLPFSEGDVAEQHRHAPRPDPSADIDDYPKALAELIQQLMAASPDARPASASAVIDALKDILAA